MTPSEAIEIARLKAGEINYPWSSEAAVAKRWGILPGRRYWRVVSRIQSQGATITMNVYERTGKAHPVRGVWATDECAPVKPGLVLLLVFKLMVSGSLVWLIERYAAHEPIWRATLIAIPGAIAATIFYEMLTAHIAMSRARNDIFKKRAGQQEQRRTSHESQKE
jgi:hypothetical protein